MEIFIKNNSQNQEEQIIFQLFEKLSSFYYPKVIGTFIYYIFKSYAYLFKNIYDLITKVENNLSLYNIDNNVYHLYNKIYENFGYLVGLQKLYDQNYFTYNINYNLTSYVISLLYGIDAYLNSGSLRAINNVGRIFTGIRPNYKSIFEKYDGWKLSNLSGNIIAIGDSFIILDNIDNRSNQIILEVSNPNNYQIGNKIFISNNKLGVNTKIYSKNHYFNFIKLMFYSKNIPNDEELYKSQRNSILKNIALINHRFKIEENNNFYVWIPNENNIEFLYNLRLNQKFGFLENISENKSIFITKPIEIQNYNNYIFDIDYNYIQYNKNKIYFYARNYINENIPDTIYYSKVTNKIEKKLLSLDGINSDRFLSTYDLSLVSTKRNYKLNLYSLTPNSIILKKSRDRLRAIPFLKNQNSQLIFLNNNFGYNFTNCINIRFYCKGISNNKNLFAAVTLYDENSEYDFEGYFGPNFKGISFYIKNNKMKFFIQNSLNENILIEINNPSINELIDFWHLYSINFYNGNVKIWLDDKLLYNENVGLNNLPNINNSYICVELKGENIGLDELVIDDNFKTDEFMIQESINSRPDFIIPSNFNYPYLQLKVESEHERPFDTIFNQISLIPANYYYNDSGSIKDIGKIGFGYNYGYNYGVKILI